MDYAEIAKQAHCLDSAVEDVTRRLEARFQGEQPSPEAVKQWLTETLKAAAAHLFPSVPTQPWDKLGIERTVWESLSPSTKLAMARQLQPLPPETRPHPRRPVYRDLTAAELKALDAEGLSWAERHAKARQLQQTPLPAP
jgi:hypothetical protein